MIRLIFLICLLPTLLNGQKYLEVASSAEPITIDGIIDESIWDKYNVADSFYQIFPVDTNQAQMQTQLRMAFDDKFLYISAVCFSEDDDYIIPTLKRDFRAGGSDNITFLIDPVGDGNNAYMFGSNPLGVKREGIITKGGTTLAGFSTSWDQAWQAEASINEDNWTVEFKIPFRILQFDQDVRTWKFNVYRFDTQANERTTWNRIPNTQWVFNLSFMGEMYFDRPLSASSGKMTLIPYVTASSLLDNEVINPENEFQWNVGGDVKMNVGSSLKLDLTANPDFSQVEVDRQITNLDRFELFFPERRNFFLENADLFSGFGFREANPFFSRRIGIVEDTISGFNVQNTIYGGARLSGSLNENWRIGLMSMQTAPEESLGIPSSNFTVASLQRSVLSRSNLSFIFVNKQNFHEVQNELNETYNRVIGSDFNFATASNKLYGKAFAHYSLNENDLQNPFSTGLFVENINENVRLRWRHLYVGEGFEAQTGFVRRTNFFQITPSVDYLFRDTDSYVTKHGPVFTYNVIWLPFNLRTDQKVSFEYTVETIYNYFFRLGIHRELIYLLDPFDPTGTDNIEYSEESLFLFTYVQAQFRSDQRQTFSYRINPIAGNYYNGSRFGVNGRLNYFFKPFLNFAINYNYNWFNLPHQTGSVNTLLIGPRLDITFSKSLFLTTFLQYNTQAQNSNINARLQWRFAPVSDLFLVYTDNYFSDPTDPSARFIGDLKNRSFVVKASYWLGL